MSNNNNNNWDPGTIRLQVSSATTTTLVTDASNATVPISASNMIILMNMLNTTTPILMSNMQTVAT